jgi:signal transduction histidine kinase
MIGRLKRRLFSKIGIRLAAGFIILLLMLASLALYSSVTSRAALAEGVGLASEAIAESLADSMDTLIYMKSHEMTTVLGSHQVVAEVSESNAAYDAMEDPQAYIDQTDENWTSAPLDEIPEFMEAILSSNVSLLLRALLIEHYTYEHGLEIFEEVILTNRYGALIAATERTTDFRQDDESWWTDAWGKELLITDIKYDDSAGVFGVWACASVQSEAGEVIGVAKAIINVLPVAKDIELTALGYETSELKIVTSDGLLVFATRAYVMLQNVSSSAFFMQVTSDRGHFSEREGSTDRLFSYATSKGYLEYEGHGWLVFLSHAEDEVLGPAIELQWRIFSVAVLALALGAVISVALSRSITGPIAALDSAARSLAKGDMSQRIDASRKDELGRLAETFNEMAGGLNVLYSGLDSLVKERTKELETANKKLGVLGSITRHDALNQIVIQKGWLGRAMEVSQDPVINDYLRKVETSTDNLVSFLRFTSEYEEVGINKPEWIDLEEALFIATEGRELTRVTLRSAVDGLEVLADPMFPKVLHNLITNSLKHGQTVTTISLSYKETSENLAIVLEDDGVGIPHNKKDLIFQREHVSGRRSHGLFLAAEILRMTNIEIRETGIPGKGARFEMLVPRGGYRTTKEPEGSSSGR